MQAHFAHKSGGCSEESFVHFICKNWLFEKGCQFKVNGVTYEVSDIQTEKTLHTNFGDYRPDIIVNTSEGKQFFFEIKYTNKKTELYAPKWDELGNDVVEVDAREFINNKHTNEIPEFKLIYSDGECFIKSYSRTDYEDTIAKRKLEWKRQDKLNYKIQWERLDWFWNTLQEYINKNVASEIVLQKFEETGLDNIESCWNIVSKMSCLKDLKQQFRDIVNKITREEFVRHLIETQDQYKDKIVIDILHSYCLPKEGIFIKLYQQIHGRYQQSINIPIQRWVILPSELDNAFIRLEREINLILYQKEKEKHIETYVTEERFPLLFHDIGIEWDTHKIPQKINTGYNLLIDNYEFDFDKIDLIINDYYTRFKDELNESGYRDFTINVIIQCVYDYLKKDTYLKDLDIEKTYDSILFYFCNQSYIVLEFGNNEIKSSNFNLSYFGLKISEICENICTYCIKITSSKSFSFAELVNDIMVEGNNSRWKMDCDYSTYDINIKFTYLYKFLNDYTKRNIVTEVCNLNKIIDTSITISLENYAECKNIIRNYLVNVMQKMLDEEKYRFEQTHEGYGICIVGKGGIIIE